VGIPRKLAAVLCYSLAAFGALLSLLGFLEAQYSRWRRAKTDSDFTGAALLESFLAIYVVPVTLTALIAAIMLRPPAGRRDRAEVSPAERSPARADGSLLALALLIFGVGYLAYVRHIIGGPFPSGGLFWWVFSPSIAMVIAIGLAAWRLARPRD
jgi:hypothetical protein